MTAAKMMTRDGGIKYFSFMKPPKNVQKKVRTVYPELVKPEHPYGIIIFQINSYTFCNRYLARINANVFLCAV